MDSINGLAVELIKKYSLGKLVHLEPVSGGEVNHVYLLETDSQKVVLRVNDAREYERFKKEEWAAQMAAEHGVLTPQVLYVGKNGAYAYMLITYVTGVSGRKIVPTPELWRRLGIFLRLIHEVPVEGFGESPGDILKGDLNEWQQYVQYNINSMAVDDVLITEGILDNETSQKLRAAFEELVTTDFTFGLSHGDYSLSNIIVDEDRPHVIDWGSAQAHVVPHHDLRVIIDESLDDASDEFHALLQGYGMSLDDYKTMRPDIASLYLLEMTDKLRWAFDKSPMNVPYYTGQLQKCLAHL